MSASLYLSYYLRILAIHLTVGCNNCQFMDKYSANIQSVIKDSPEANQTNANPLREKMIHGPKEADIAESWTLGPFKEDEVKAAVV